MKGYRFYADYDSAAHRRRDTVGSRSQRATTPDPAKNVIALLVGPGGYPLYGGPTEDCVSSLFDLPNSDVAGSGVSPDYLRERCRRISEAEARRIHPKMFEYLER